jgi:predicted membrane GTPase involved in stress response
MTADTDSNKKKTALRSPTVIVTDKSDSTDIGATDQSAAQMDLLVNSSIPHGREGRYITPTQKANETKRICVYNLEIKQ